MDLKALLICKLCVLEPFWGRSVQLSGVPGRPRTLWKEEELYIAALVGRSHLFPDRGERAASQAPRTWMMASYLPGLRSGKPFHSLFLSPFSCQIKPLCWPYLRVFWAAPFLSTASLFSPVNQWVRTLSKGSDRENSMFPVWDGSGLSSYDWWTGFFSGNVTASRETTGSWWSAVSIWLDNFSFQSGNTH
jgi:hypothetical protein